MNLILWILVGGAIGWAGFSLAGINRARGRMVSIAIGVGAGVVGGQILAPMLRSTAITAGDWSLYALFIAAVSAIACLVIGNMIHSRFGV